MCYKLCMCWVLFGVLDESVSGTHIGFVISGTHCIYIPNVPTQMINTNDDKNMYNMQMFFV